MDIYKQYKKLTIDKSYLGLEPGDTNGGYFCTPEHCHVIGWAGVDGIHYGFVEKFGEMVFAINPMPIGEQCVYPLAENFEVFLQLILAGKGVNSIEQIEHFSPAQFAKYLETDCADDPAYLEKRQVALHALQAALHLEPHPDPYGYVKRLQADFDYEAIPYSDEYYDVTGLENPRDTQKEGTYEQKRLYPLASHREFGSHVHPNPSNLRKWAYLAPSPLCALWNRSANSGSL